METKTIKELKEIHEISIKALHDEIKTLYDLHNITNNTINNVIKNSE